MRKTRMTHIRVRNKRAGTVSYCCAMMRLWQVYGRDKMPALAYGKLSDQSSPIRDNWDKVGAEYSCSFVVVPM